MYCPQCGKQNVEGAAVCAQCGANLAGQGMAPPPPGGQGMPPGMPVSGPSYPAGGLPQVPNYLVQAILVTVFCCLPFGIVSIVYAAQVNGKLQAGDYQGAVMASDNARKWAWIAFGVGLAFAVIWIGLNILGVMAGMAGAEY